MTGRLPFRFNATWDNTIVPSTALTLAKALKQAGYTTAGFVSAPYILLWRQMVLGKGLTFTMTRWQI